MAVAKANFNPHSREGSDDCGLRFGLGSRNFNPHSREGSDWGAVGTLTKNQISIHTPAKGVTYVRQYQAQEKESSIHTPAKGVTDVKEDMEYLMKISIHTPAKGVTYYLLYLWIGW